MLQTVEVLTRVTDRKASEGCNSVAKAPGIHDYVAGSIPAVTPRYCTVKTINALRITQKKDKKRKADRQRV
jgi:hypothetical protein